MHIALLGAAFSAGGAHPGCRHGPAAFHTYEFPRWHRQLRHKVRWAGTVREGSARALRWPQGARQLATNAKRLMRRVRRLRSGGQFPVVIGGDHSCAIGSWSGINATGLQPFGLLWIDAHLDSHTPDTSETGRLHGMPLAVLLGEGDQALTSLAGHRAVAPRFCAVIGARSYEEGEPRRLERLGVRFYTRDDIARRGLGIVLAEAWRRVAAAPGGFGVSLDMDALDPMLAPGVSVPEERGLNPRQLARLLRQQPSKHRLRGLEVVELNPRRDPQGRTRRLLPTLLTALIMKR